MYEPICEMGLKPFQFATVHLTNDNSLSFQPITSHNGYNGTNYQGDTTFTS